MDWAFTNVTAGATHLLVSNETAGVNETYPVNPLTFELRVTNWAYGIQIDKVHVAAGESLVKIPPYNRTIEFIGDSLSAGMYTSYEGLSSFAYGVGAGLGETEYYVTAYPGICVTDQDVSGIMSLFPLLVHFRSQYFLRELVCKLRNIRNYLGIL